MSDEIITTLVRMMRERASYHFNLENPLAMEGMAAAMAYDTCADLLEYALAGDIDAIHQYDYYSK